MSLHALHSPALAAAASALPTGSPAEPLLDTASLFIADELASAAGVTDVDVLLACALAIRAPRHGHVAADLSQPPEPATDPEAPSPWPTPQAWLAALHAAPTLVRTPQATARTPFVLDGHLLYTDRYWRYQSQLAAGLLALAEAGHLRVITGGPGTGKTTSIRTELLALFQGAVQRGDEPPSVALAAPTGKAAARVTQALTEDLDLSNDPAESPTDPATWLSTLEGKTLHRLLGFRYRTPTRFKHDASNPLPHELVIVDEASMIDLALMAKLVAAIDPCRTTLYLLGDADQLTSVEAGTVLSDIVGPAREAIPATGPLATSVQVLRTNYRYGPGSGVGAFAKACLARDADAALDALGPDYSDTALIPWDFGARDLPEAAIDTLVVGYSPYLAEVFSPQPDPARVLALFEAFRVLCPRRSGPFGVRRLNDRVAELLSERGRFPGRSRFKPRTSGGHYAGQPILIRENAYDLGLWNGDTGVVMFRPGSTELEVVFADRAPLAVSRLPAHETCFATTIHKSQGSQHAHTMTVLPGARGAAAGGQGSERFLTRNLVYTAVTRTRVGAGAEGLPGLEARATVVARAETVRAAIGCEVLRASGLGVVLWPQHHQGDLAPRRTS